MNEDNIKFNFKKTATGLLKEFNAGLPPFTGGPCKYIV
jgi:hypothetical protein